LIEDANFFKLARLIDYSLLIFKIDWGKYMEDLKITEKDIYDKISNPLYVLHSVKENGVLYLFYF